MMPKRRQSIHPDEKMAEDRIEEVVLKCELCSDFYLILEGQAQTRLTEEKLKAWQDLAEKKRKTGVYPNITEAPFHCQNCEVKERAPINAKTIQTSVPGTGVRWGNIISLGVVVFAVLLLVFGVTYHEELQVLLKEETPFKVNMYDQSTEEIKFEDELYSLDKRYGRQEDKVWYTLAAGIKSVMNTKPNQPSVFLMLFDSESAGNTAKCLAQDVSKTATKYLMKREKIPFLISGAELNQKLLLNDPGHLLVKYNATVRDRGAMIITNIQDVPPIVATSFHFLCDSYSPLVERAIYFFTLKVEQLSSWKLHKKAEDRLTELWSGSMTDSQLQPLITRMTPNVLRIASDSSDC